MAKRAQSRDLAFDIINFFPKSSGKILKPWGKIGFSLLIVFADVYGVVVFGQIFVVIILKTLCGK